MRARTQRRKQIVAVCADLRDDSFNTPHGIDPNNYEVEDLVDVVKNCTGFEHMSEPEVRLAVVAFELGAAEAKKSIWYK